MEYISKKYINLISNKLGNFSWKNNDLAVFKCPKCGDSKKNKRLTRGNFFVYKNVAMFHCYNCGEPQGFASFLYDFDRGLYREYRMEKFQESIAGQKKEPVEDNFEAEVATFKTKAISKPIIEEPNLFDGYQTFTELKDDHPAKQYAIDRNLESFFDRIYYIPNFPVFAIEFEGLDRWEKVKKHSRMLFPCYSYENDGKLIGFSARAFLDDQIRYCTWKDKTYDGRVLFGLDTVNELETVYVVEGVVDSLMIDNAVAVMSSALNSVEYFDDKVLIFDHQPRNSVIVKLVKNAIDDGKKVVIWPDSFPAKDLNEAVEDHGYTKEQLMNIIKEYTYSGLMADIQFKRWKKV